jgi:hypothetical protein
MVREKFAGWTASRRRPMMTGCPWGRGLDVTEPTPTHQFPGGEDSPAYRRAFTAWLVLFLGVISLGLLNYLGLFLKSRF